VYRISWFRFVNPRKCNIQALQAWTLGSVRFSFFAMSRSLKPLPTKRQTGPNTPTLSQKTRMRLTSTSDSSNATGVQIDQRLVRSAHATAAVACARGRLLSLFLDIGHQDFSG